MGTDTVQSTPAAPPHPAPEPPAPAPDRPRSAWRFALWAFAALAVAAGAAGGYFAFVRARDAEPRPKAATIPVNTIVPTRTTLVRTHEQPGSVLPYAQAELSAKTSG
jgi:hypothetical protein